MKRSTLLLSSTAVFFAAFSSGYGSSDISSEEIASATSSQTTLADNSPQSPFECAPVPDDASVKGTQPQETILDVEEDEDVGETTGLLSSVKPSSPPKSFWERLFSFHS